MIDLASPAALVNGLILAGSAALVVALRSIPATVYRWARRRLIITVLVDDRDEAFIWIEQWLAAQPYTSTARLLALRTRRAAGDESMSQPYLTLAPGLHALRYRGRWLAITRNRQEGSGPGGMAMVKESFTLALTGRHRSVVDAFIADVKALAAPPPGPRTRLCFALWSEWSSPRDRAPRRLESVILAGDLAGELERDLATFLAARDWYAERGIPWRRGYLLHGPPGGGKTSIVQALACHFGLTVHVLSPAAEESDESLRRRVFAVPERSVLLIEDVDSVFVGRDKLAAAPRLGAASETPPPGVTFSGLLNALDGVAAGEGVAVFMTTNHREQLDPALIRPGRVDVDRYIGHATPDQARRLWRRFYGAAAADTDVGSHADLVGAWAANAVAEAGQQVSMAQLQGYCLRHSTSPESALTELHMALYGDGQTAESARQAMAVGWRNGTGHS